MHNKSQLRPIGACLSSILQMSFCLLTFQVHLLFTCGSLFNLYSDFFFCSKLFFYHLYLLLFCMLFILPFFLFISLFFLHYKIFSFNCEICFLSLIDFFSIFFFTGKTNYQAPQNLNRNHQSLIQNYKHATCRPQRMHTMTVSNKK